MCMFNKTSQLFISIELFKSMDCFKVTSVYLYYSNNIIDILTYPSKPTQYVSHVPKPENIDTYGR
uniref:Uncharacterized protein n=1 Tax=uncultured marine virus TaxID=186617 RepID=A0A0F7LAW9_9VIRU|nr:hypothetical protein [uncultured marine virus]